MKGGSNAEEPTNIDLTDYSRYFSTLIVAFFLFEPSSI